MKKVLPALAFLGLSCAAVSGPPHRDAWGPFSVVYGIRDYEPRMNSFSVRGGGFVPTGGSEKYDPTLTAGVAYARERLRSNIKFMEFGIDVTVLPTVSKLGEREATIYLGRLEIGIGPVSGQWGLYGLAGVLALYEDSIIVLSKKRETYWSPNLTLGVGYRTRRFDARANYVLMLLTKNVTGFLVVGAGFYF